MLNNIKNRLFYRAVLGALGCAPRPSLMAACAICTAASFVVLPTQAEEGAAPPAEEKDRPWEKEGLSAWGGIRFYPSIDYVVYYDNNILSEEGAKKGGSYVIGLSPQISAGIGEAFEEGQLGAHIKADVGSYLDSNDDNYIDITTLLDYDWEPTESLALYAGFQYIWGHEARGTEGMAGSQAWLWDQGQGAYVPVELREPSEFEEWGVIARVRYDLSSGDQVSLEGRHEDRGYTNNRDWTRYRDYTANRGALSFAHRLAPNTAMTLSGSVNQYDYAAEGAAGNLDSTQYDLMVGAKWDITYQTDGFAKLGWGWKEFDSRAREDASAFVWEVGVNWRPLSYSTVTAKTSQGFEESDGHGDYAKVSRVSLDWNHEWYSFVSSSLGVAYSQSDWAGSNREFGGGVNRQDDLLEYYARLTYQPWKWLGFGLGWRHTERDSNWDQYSYDDDVYELRIKAGLSLLDAVRSIGFNL